jgi:hypothetical protein
MVIFMAVEAQTDWNTDQIDKYVPIPSLSPLELGIGDLAFFKPVLTKTSISDEADREVHRIRAQSAGTRAQSRPT